MKWEKTASSKCILPRKIRQLQRVWQSPQWQYLTCDSILFSNIYKNCELAHTHIRTLCFCKMFSTLINRMDAITIAKFFEKWSLFDGNDSALNCTNELQCLWHDYPFICTHSISYHTLHRTENGIRVLFSSAWCFCCKCEQEGGGTSDKI